jgi:hypothetical protein
MRDMWNLLDPVAAVAGIPRGFGATRSPSQRDRGGHIVQIPYIGYANGMGPDR